MGLKRFGAFQLWQQLTTLPNEPEKNKIIINIEVERTERTSKQQYILTTSA